jgi:acyl carrier protein
MIQDIAQIEKTIFKYLSEHTSSDVTKVTSQTLLFREGIFDSMGFILLIDFLEENFGIKASDADLIEENFESIKAITNYLHNKITVNAA